MAKFQNAYHKQVWQLGYATVSAKSLSFEKYDQLMLGLFQDSTRLLPGLPAAGSSGYRFSAAKPLLLLLLRDMLAFSLAWSSAVRAHNAGIVAAEDLQDRRGSPLFDQLQQPQFPFAAGFQWQFAPNGTKARQGRRAGVLQLSVLPAAEEHRCFLRLLHKDPRHRITAEELLQHPWVSGTAWMALLPGMSRALEASAAYQDLVVDMAHPLASFNAEVGGWRWCGWGA